MLTRRISGWNMAFGAPEGWDAEKDGPCNALPVRVSPPEAIGDSSIRVATCESAWEPSPSELEWLNQGGHVVLRVVGWQPAVALFAEPPEPDVAHALSSNFARGFATAIGLTTAVLEHATSMAMAHSAILSLLGQMRLDIKNDPDADMAVTQALMLNLQTQIMTTAINALDPTLFDLPPDAKALAADLRAVAVRSGLVVPDDLHHAPRCPANHFHGRRLPTGPCTCGARAEREGQEV